MTPGQEEFAHEELRRAEEALREAQTLLERDLTAGAASRTYYAVFHAARAALTIRGVYSKTHSGQITLFERTFGETPVLRELLKLRAEADYATGPFDARPDVLRTLLDAAKQLVDRCRDVVEEAAARGPEERDPPPDL